MIVLEDIFKLNIATVSDFGKVLISGTLIYVAYFNLDSYKSIKDFKLYNIT